MCLQAATKTEAGALPSEAALVRQPSVAAAVHQTLLDMPAPPLAGPLSDSSSGSRDLAMSEGKSQMLKTLCSSLSQLALSSSGSQDLALSEVESQMACSSLSQCALSFMAVPE